MQLTELIAKTNNLTSDAEVAYHFKALRQDILVWEGLQRIFFDPEKLELLIKDGTPLNPGSVGLFAFDSNMGIKYLTDGGLSQSLLEKAMLGYESYLLTDSPMDSLDSAVGVALALRAKKQVAGQWKEVFNELIARTKNTDHITYVRRWKSIFAILINLIPDHEDFLRDLVSAHPAEIGSTLVVHLILCLPIQEDEQAGLLARQLSHLDELNRVHALKILKQTGGVSLAGLVAGRLLDTYRDLDVSRKTTSDYWQDPISSTQNALRFQAIADIAHIAGDENYAVRMNDTALEILTAMVKRGKVKKAGLINVVVPEMSTLDLFSEEEIKDPEVQTELLYSNSFIEPPTDAITHPVKLIRQSQKNAGAGNLELAREEIRTALNDLTESELEKMLVYGPAQIPSWDPTEYLKLLVTTGAYEEAGKLAGILLRDNPSDLEVNLEAAKAAVGREDHSTAIKYWETLTALQADNFEYKRSLGKSLVASGKLGNAHVIYRTLTEDGRSGDLEDLLAYGEISLDIDRPEVSLLALNKVLENSPDHFRALVLSAKAYRKTGQRELAVDRYRQAMQLSDDDPMPWIELADLYWASGDHEQAITVLKEGVAAMPGNFQVRSSYAGKLMQEGFTSEAYPLLSELSNKNTDVEVDLLLIEAMERLGMENIAETLEVLVTRYPDDVRFLGDYGKRLIWNGETERGLSFLQRVGEGILQNDELALAYIEAVNKPDYRSLVFNKITPGIEKRNTFNALERVVTNCADEPHARLLNAEFLIATGDVEAAFNRFNELISEYSSTKNLDQARVFTGLALAATRTGRTEIAMAALDQVAALQPGWLALVNIKAEILQQSGEFTDAIKLVVNTLQNIPDDPVNYSWAINFIQKCGDHEETEKLIISALEKFPQNPGLILAKIEYELLAGEREPDLEMQDNLYNLIEGIEDVDLLIRSAHVFAAMGNQERTIFSLNKAHRLGSQAARLNLAGLYRIRKEFALSWLMLEEMEVNPSLNNLLKNELLYAQGRLDEIELMDLENEIHFEEIIISEPFTPSEWMELFHSAKPMISLMFRIAITTGDYVALHSSIKNWITAEPGNIEALVYGVETALADGDVEGAECYLQQAPNHLTGDYAPQLELLIKEKQLDDGSPLAEDPDAITLFEVINTEEPQKIIRIRELLNAGRLPDAETTFEMCFSIFSTPKDNSLVKEIGLLRNLAKSALELFRWADAFQLLKRASGLAPQHKGMALLELKTKTLYAEFQNRAGGLGIQAHAQTLATLENPQASTPSPYSDLWKFPQADFQHWLTRLNLAENSSLENVRALAQLTPNAEDAAALMVGLRAVDQVNTAKQVGKKFAQDKDVLLELALCESPENVDKAIEYTSNSLELDPYQPLALRLLARFFEQAGLITEAVNAIEHALHYWPNETNWHLDAAELCKQLGNLDKTIEHLRLAGIYSPNDVEIKRKIGITALTAKRPTEALPYLLTVVENQPDSGETWTALSSVYQMTGEIELAAEAADKAIRVDPSAVEARLQAGKVSWARGELDKAIEQVKLAISLNPEDSGNYVFMARLYAEKGDKGKALELLEKASHYETGTVRTVIDHANLLKQLNGSIAARDLIASFSQKFPENPELLMLLAEAEDMCGETTAAEVVAKKALKIDPRDKEIHMLLGRILEKDGNLDQAAHYFSQAATIDPAFIDAYLKLSQVLIRQREYTKARQVLEQGIENAPANINLYLTCATLLKEIKDYHGAETMLRKAATLEPRNVLIHRQLGAILALNMVHQSQEVSTQI